MSQCKYTIELKNVELANIININFLGSLIKPQIYKIIEFIQRRLYHLLDIPTDICCNYRAVVAYFLDDRAKYLGNC